jgi:hypothetical protein
VNFSHTISSPFTSIRISTLLSKFCRTLQRERAVCVFCTIHRLNHFLQDEYLVSILQQITILRRYCYKSHSSLCLFALLLAVLLYIAVLFAHVTAFALGASPAYLTCVASWPSWAFPVQCASFVFMSVGNVFGRLCVCVFCTVRLKICTYHLCILVSNQDFGTIYSTLSLIIYM